MDELKAAYEANQLVIHVAAGLVGAGFGTHYLRKVKVAAALGFWWFAFLVLVGAMYFNPCGNGMLTFKLPVDHPQHHDDDHAGERNEHRQEPDIALNSLNSGDDTIRGIRISDLNRIRLAGKWVEHSDGSIGWTSHAIIQRVPARDGYWQNESDHEWRFVPMTHSERVKAIDRIIAE